jgi:hypothetical protein
MWKLLAALLVCATPALAQERASAYDALRVVGNRNRDLVNHVISVTGTNGDPQPETWKILIDDPNSRGGIREVAVRNGRIESERAPTRSVVGSSEGATINTTRLNLDSSGAYAVASHTAEKSGTRFETVSYTLRTDERGDPTWIVTLHAQNGRPVGTIHIGANRGNITRTEGMFAGTNMNDVVTDHEARRHTDEVRDENSDENMDEGDDNEHGIFYGARSRIRETFRHTQDEARDMFDRVRRSFTDFINRG